MKLKLKPSYSTLAIALTIMAKAMAEDNLEVAALILGKTMETALLTKNDMSEEAAIKLINYVYDFAKDNVEQVKTNGKNLTN